MSLKNINTAVSKLEVLKFQLLIAIYQKDKSVVAVRFLL